MSITVAQSAQPALELRSLEAFQFQHRKQRPHLIARGHIERPDNLSLLHPRHLHAKLQALQQSPRVGQALNQDGMQCDVPSAPASR
jgi:hypothetical protein